VYDVVDVPRSDDVLVVTVDVAGVLAQSLAGTVLGAAVEAFDSQHFQVPPLAAAVLQVGEEGVRSNAKTIPPALAA